MEVNITTTHQKKNKKPIVRRSNYTVVGEKGDAKTKVKGITTMQGVKHTLKIMKIVGIERAHIVNGSNKVVRTHNFN